MHASTYVPKPLMAILALLSLSPLRTCGRSAWLTGCLCRIAAGSLNREQRTAPRSLKSIGPNISVYIMTAALTSGPAFKSIERDVHQCNISALTLVFRCSKKWQREPGRPNFFLREKRADVTDSSLNDTFFNALAIASRRRSIEYTSINHIRT